MERILFLTDDGKGDPTRATREALGAAVALLDGSGEHELILGIVGSSAQAAANRFAGCGATRMLGVSGEGFDVSRYATDAAAAEALVRRSEATLVLAPATTRWQRALPGVAQRMGGRIDTQITALAMGEDGPKAERWFYRQRIRGTFRRTARPWFLSIAPGVHAPWNGEGGTATLETLTVEPPVTRTEVIGEEAAAGSTQTIRPEADLLFVAGAGWTKKQPDGMPHVDEAERLILGFVESARASLGSSKSLVDQSTEGQQVLGCLTHLNQVGQTGATPRHPKGLATCCHGEEPHVVGWRFIGERRAVNLDPNCGWAQGKADVVYVADAFEVMRRVNEMLTG
jgi:electron transfer flavoprotein alpha subunit